jgi:hypothetical protein
MRHAVVAAEVGGLRSLVDHGPHRLPVGCAALQHAEAIERVLGADPRRCANGAASRSRTLRVGHRRRTPSPSLRRPHAAGAGPVSLTPETAHALVRDHLEGPVAAEPYIQTVEYDPELHRWYVRFTCDTRDATTIYFDLHQRTLRYEVYFLPAPPEPSAELYEFLLRRHHAMSGARFSLGPARHLPCGSHSST